MNYFDRKIAQLEKQVMRLESRVSNLPVRIGLGGASQMRWQFYVVKDGSGDEGDNTGAADFAYDLYEFPAGTRLLAESIDVDSPRSVGRRAIAPDGSIGVGYQDDVGDYVLIWVFGETEGYISCMP